MTEGKREDSPTSPAMVSPIPDHGGSIEGLRVIASRGQECLGDSQRRADARLDSLRRARYQLSGQGRQSAHDVYAKETREFGCGLRVAGKKGAGFAVAEGEFSWTSLLNAAEARASSGYTAAGLPPSGDRKPEGQTLYPSPTEAMTPTRSSFARLHEELRGIRPGFVLGDLELWCTMGWRAVLQSGGATLMRDLHDLRLSAVGTVTSPWGETWTMSVSAGSTTDWPRVGEAMLRAVAGLERLLRFGQQAERRDYAGPVVLDPQVAGFLAHEAIGHLSEADRLPHHARRQIVAGGRVRVGPDELNVTDHVQGRATRGAVPFDDEGVRGTGAPLVRGGYWQGLLHSRQTAFADRAMPTGNARTTSYRHVPMCRMRTTEIHSGGIAREDILRESSEALYLGCPQEGEVPGGNVRIRTWAWRLRDGEVRDCLGPVTLCGEAPTVLAEIDAVGTDRSVVGGHPGCGRKEQPGLLPVTVIAPTLRLRRANVRFG